MLYERIKEMCGATKGVDENISERGLRCSAILKEWRVIGLPKYYMEDGEWG